MALQDLPNKQGFILQSDNNLTSAASVVTTLDAAGESRTHIGKVYLEAGTGSKTISSSGGAIRWRVATVGAFANAGTTIRIGIQDVASGVEDGTFDVYADLVGGTDTITSSTEYLTPMETGTKTISHGDLIAISVEMISKGGSDSIQVSAMNTGIHARASTGAKFPYITQDTGTGPSKSASATMAFAIEFDDGTLGWITPGILIPGTFSISSQSFANNSTPDEYAAVFQVPFKCRISGGHIWVGSIGTTDNFEIILYSDPTGTPTVIETITMDPLLTGSTAAGVEPYLFTFATPRELTPNTEYAIALRPTTTGSIAIGYIDLTSGNTKYKNPLPFGSTLEFMARTNQSGAFTSVQTYHLPLFGLLIDQLDDGAGSSGGGEVSHVF